ncbi:serine hydrolase [Spirosoma sp. KNUC1025]|uniref:serine hydrolase domain-containing protein n=1 Tax=Spirosoma sp. KNUC1025 TaxID=2894082 RepID=UPI003870A822|nr:beta-lactamase family protein [Spirosoma sp. KNUC1025]
MRFLIVLLLLSLFTSLIPSLFGQAASSLQPAQIRCLDSIASQDVPAHSPGIATGIVRNGRIVYSYYVGYANLTDSVLINQTTRFNLASNAKQFTALAILLLADQKRLSLEDDIRTYIPGLYSGINHKISLKHLLNHSSGIRDVYDLWSLQGVTWWKTTLTNQDALTLLQKQQELNFSPGTSYSYSNSNYILLATLVEQVTGEPFVQYTQKLFAKLGMHHTSFVDNHKAILEPIAKPYFNFDRWVNYDWLCDIHGDGNLFTTLADQLVWETIIQLGHHDSLPPGLIQRSQKLVEHSPVTSYGYGLEFGRYQGLSYRFHEGATGAWKATLIRFPTDSLSVITLTNSGKTLPATQTRQMADLLLRTKLTETTTLRQPKQVGVYKAIPDVLGIYLNANDFSFQFIQRDTSLYLIRFGRNDVQLVRESANCFHQLNDPSFKLEFTTDQTGHLQVTAYHPTHAPYTLGRRDHDWQGFDLGRINGTYRNEETNQSLLINHLSNQQFSVKLGGQEVAGVLVSPTKLLCDGFQVALPSRGKPTTVYLDLNRLKNVRFKRVNP